jgi:hypothetical protein
MIFLLGYKSATKSKTQKSLSVLVDFTAKPLQKPQTYVKTNHKFYLFIRGGIVTAEQNRNGNQQSLFL